MMERRVKNGMIVICTAALVALIIGLAIGILVGRLKEPVIPSPQSVEELKTEIEIELERGKDAIERAKADAQRAIAEAEKAKADAQKATAEVDKAKADAQKATAEADKAKADAKAEVEMESQVFAPNEQWLERYGAGEKTTIYFNLAVLKFNIARQQEQLKAQAARITTLEGLYTRPNDVNVPTGWGTYDNKKGQRACSSTQADVCDWESGCIAHPK